MEKMLFKIPSLWLCSVCKTAHTRPVAPPGRDCPHSFCLHHRPSCKPRSNRHGRLRAGVTQSRPGPGSASHLCVMNVCGQSRETTLPPCVCPHVPAVVPAHACATPVCGHRHGDHRPGCCPCACGEEQPFRGKGAPWIKAGATLPRTCLPCARPQRPLLTALRERGQNWSLETWRCGDGGLWRRGCAPSVQ